MVTSEFFPGYPRPPFSSDHAPSTSEGRNSPSELEPLFLQGTELALKAIEERYQHPSNPDDALPYHSQMHTLSVLSRTERLTQAMLLTAEERGLAQLAAAYHDVYQDDQNREAKRLGLRIRHRLYPSNEEKSAREATAWMEQQRLFNQTECDLVKEAILVTVPGHIEMDGHQTLYQPRLNTHTHPLARAVALADLHCCGMDGKRFSDEADSLFREMQIEITVRMRTLASRSEIDGKTQALYKRAMIDWRARQVQFARDRAARLEGELMGLTSVQRGAVKTLFSKYDEAIEECKKVVEERKKMTFWEAASATGYTLPPE